MKTVMGDAMREVLRDYHQVVELPYLRGAYVKMAPYSYYPNLAFIVTPFDKYLGKQYMVTRSWDNLWWEFIEIPF